MRFDSLLTPLSEAEPCGPDLDEMGDDAFLNYMMRADNQLPSRYLDFEKSPEGVPFDPTSIDLRAETKAIAGFLEQTRDLRLLTLEARFQALSGQIAGFCECVQAIAALVSTFWEDVNPKGFEGDFTLRQNAIGALDSRATVVTALEHAPILRDRRAGTITLRDNAIANGSAAPREGERRLDTATILDAIGAESNRAAINEVHSSLAACRAAVATIQTAFDDATGSRFSPDFDGLRGVLAQMMALIEQGRPDLAAGGARPASATDDTALPDMDAAGVSEAERPAAASGAPAAAARAGAVTIAHRASATAALLAAEQYIGRHETSSPALILVHQARMLVGQPLVVALEALLPDRADGAVIVVDPTFGFEFSMSKMRAITDDYTANASTHDDENGDVAVFTAETRQQASSLIQGVSTFFRSAEPSSPIPMLLTKADRYLSQNFQAILTDLMEKMTSSR